MRQEAETSIELASGERAAFVWNDAGVPLPNNTEFVIKSGAVGTPMAFRLTAYNGVVRLIQATVTISIKNLNTGEICVKNALCEAHQNQYQNAGFGVFVFDEASGNLPEGNYGMEFMVRRETGQIEFYPTGKFINFVKLTIQPSLGR